MKTRLVLLVLIPVLLLVGWSIARYTPIASMAAIPPPPNEDASGTVEITVCPSGPPVCDYATIQEAVDAALAQDAILVGPGTYTETVVISKTLSLVGSGVANTTVDAAYGDRVFSIRPGIAVTITDLSLAHGSALEIDGVSRGGGILNQARLTLVNVTIRDSLAQGLPGIDGNESIDGTDGGHGYGGGVYNGCTLDACGTLIMTDTLIVGNVAGGGAGGRIPEDSGREAGDGGVAHGGGVYNDCAASSCGTIVGARVTVLGNRAQGGDAGCADDLLGCLTAVAGDGSGGGVFNAGTLALDDSAIDANDADAGELWLYIPYPGADGSYGGGVRSVNQLTLRRSAVVNNSSGHGAGLSNSGVAVAENSTFSGNRAQGWGGGIYNPSGIVTLTNVTVGDNLIYPASSRYSGSGGGVYSDGEIRMHNSIIAQNYAECNFMEPYCAQDCSGTIQSLGFNLIQDASHCTIVGDQLGNVIDKLAFLVPLRDNGGHTPTQALLFASPAVDGGDPDACPATDQRGEYRPADGDGDGTAVCDMGAYEGVVPPTDFVFLPCILRP